MTCHTSAERVYHTGLDVTGMDERGDVKTRGCVRFIVRHRSGGPWKRKELRLAEGDGRSPRCCRCPRHSAAGGYLALGRSRTRPRFFQRPAAACLAPPGGEVVHESRHMLVEAAAGSAGLGRPCVGRILAACEYVLSAAAGFEPGVFAGNRKSGCK